jgi:Flp pilus assembly protein TadD
MANVYRQRRDQAETVATYEKAIACYRAQVEADPTDWEGWATLGQGYNILGGAYWEFARPGEAIVPFREAGRAYRAAVRLAPQDPRALNYLAWFLAACPDERFRDPVEAASLAERATRLAPEAGNHWNTLGVARYRAGDLDGCLSALRRSMDLSGGGDGIDWFFMAMSLTRNGDRAGAAAWYDRAVRWMDRSNPREGELLRLRSETAALLSPQQGDPGPGPPRAPSR